VQQPIQQANKQGSKQGLLQKLLAGRQMSKNWLIAGRAQIVCLQAGLEEAVAAAGSRVLLTASSCCRKKETTQSAGKYDDNEGAWSCTALWELLLQQLFCWSISGNRPGSSCTSSSSSVVAAASSSPWSAVTNIRVLLQHLHLF
jgi:hypothetical protein